MEYLIRFDKNGRRCETYVKFELDKDRIDSLLSSGYIEVTEADYQLLVGNIDGKEHIRNNDGTYSVYVVEVTLEEVKTSKKNALKYERDKKEVAVIAYKGKTFDYDDKARERLNIARQALEDNNLPSQMWTCADNTDIELTVEDFKNINSLAAQRSGQLHDTYRKLCDYIDKLKTADEVNAVTFDTEVIQ
nr:MAG TPA: protein of unknown function (DUF4376) [Caudoviricetes sp.]